MQARAPVQGSCTNREPRPGAAQQTQSLGQKEARLYSMYVELMFQVCSMYVNSLYVLIPYMCSANMHHLCTLTFIKVQYPAQQNK